MNSLVRAIGGLILGLCTVFVSGATPSPPNQSGTSNPPAGSVAPGSPQKQGEIPVQSGIGRPAIVVPANKDEVTTRITLRGLDAAPSKDDLEIGLLTSPQQPSLMIRPTVELIGAPSSENKDFVVVLTLRGLAPFGESSAPLLYKGRQVEVLRFSKPGLTVKPPFGNGFMVREDDAAPAILLVLENPSSFAYASIQARLRFDNQDICLFRAEKFSIQHTNSAIDQSCDASKSWTEFDIPQYTQVSLRANPSVSWFRDPASGYAKSAKRNGWLTLRFKGDNPQQIQEQNIPLEIQFEAGTDSLILSILTVAGFLALGAALSLFLRVAVPNMKRKNQLKDQLRDVSKSIATVSSEVDSNLRVLLSVERRSLEELRLAVWPLGPAYADYAARVEQGLPSLNRRVASVVRLDAALTRKKTLTEQSAAPTRLEQIEDMLSAASETLKQDQLSEEDWVFVNQRLDNAEKLLREPTQTEKEAFEAMLAGRWRAIREHFGTDANGALTVPLTLTALQGCFPETSLLPKNDEKGFSQWLDAVGLVRADLQLSALALVWEFQFLMPANVAAAGPLKEPWQTATPTINRLLSTPAVDNLREAKRLLRQLAEGVTEGDIIAALKGGGAILVMDPTIPRPDRTVRFSVRFRQEKLNTSVARQLVTCNWIFDDYFLPRIPWLGRLRVKLWSKASAKDDAERLRSHLALPENGWFVHHYFDKQVGESVVSAGFFDSAGKPIELVSGQSWPQLVVHPRPDQRGSEKWQRFFIEATQVGASLLVPLATLASNAINGGTTSHWWEIVALGFGSDTIKNIIVSKDSTSGTSTK